MSSVEKIIIKSTAFKNGGEIPSLYTCDGHDIVPDLEWNAVKDANYYAIKVDDPDVPNGVWVHWLTINIPFRKLAIDAGEPAGEAILNSFGFPNYGGPCPPSGTHRYFFRVYAFKEELMDVSMENFEEKIKGKVIAYGEIMGTYTRK